MTTATILIAKWKVAHSGRYRRECLRDVMPRNRPQLKVVTLARAVRQDEPDRSINPYLELRANLPDRIAEIQGPLDPGVSPRGARKREPLAGMTIAGLQCARKRMTEYMGLASRRLKALRAEAAALEPPELADSKRK